MAIKKPAAKRRGPAPKAPEDRYVVVKVTLAPEVLRDLAEIERGADSRSAAVAQAVVNEAKRLRRRGR